jgi:peptide deformylase
MIMSQWRVIYIAPKVCGTHLFLVNPMVVHHGAIFQHMMETCPSVPGVELDIQRWAMVTVAARKPDGDSIMIPFSGIEAQAVQHEMQHLRGECIIDSALSGKRLFLKEKVAKYGGKYGSVLRYDQTIVER